MSSPRPSGERWRRRLADAGLRVTRPRLAVLAALERLGGHRSAEEISAELKRTGDVTSRASVFNALRDLTAAALVIETGVGPGPARYEVAKTWHHHFVCTRCGAILDVPCVVGARPCLDADLPGARIDEAQVTYRGTCAACARAEGRTRDS